MDEVELSLLDEGQRRQARLDADEADGDAMGARDGKAQLTSEDKRAMVLLSVLYLIQGVPIGLALVDSKFIPSIGRRKSWIIPMQFIIGTLMLWISFNVDKLMENPANYVYTLTVVFTSLVLFAATQDIAVDGWALTLLSQGNLSYASTCQTIGLNTGFFMSFTVFLALNSEAFSEKWGMPHLSLSTYLRFWSLMCYGVTLWLVFFQKERKEILEEKDMNVT
ncbi:hypothetical protein EWM64_g6739, partial [Hericium alpestre]